jgi:serine/threonine-protein kinase
VEIETAKNSQEMACSTCGQEFDSSIENCPTDGTKLTIISSQLAPGTILGDRYEIIETVAGGGMGKVYKARHKLMKRLVAIKAMHPFLIASGAALKRFQHEAQALSQLSHPHILTVFDFFISDDSQPYLVMDYLEGTNLSEILKQDGKIDVMRGLSIFIMVCSGLNHAHEKNIVHRDIKPSNIMLVNMDENPDFVKVIDFGIAKLTSEDGVEPTKLTTTGDVFGSPEYMSPEQCRARPLDARSDIYSLGCVMYAAFSGKAPFPGQDSIECMMKHVNDMPVPFKDVAKDLVLPPGLEESIFKAIAKEPENRFQSMIELKAALELIQKGLLGETSESESALLLEKLGTSKNTSALPQFIQNKLKNLDPRLLYTIVAIALLAIISLIVLISNEKRVQVLSPQPQAAQQYQNTQAQSPEALYASYLQQGQKDFNNGNYSSAGRYFREAHKISEDFGQTDFRFIESMQWLGRVYYKQGYFPQAKQSIEWAASAYRARLGSKAPQTISCEKDLAMVKKAMSNR